MSFRTEKHRIYSAMLEVFAINFEKSVYALSENASLPFFKNQNGRIDVPDRLLHIQI